MEYFLFWGAIGTIIPFFKTVYHLIQCRSAPGSILTYINLHLYIHIFKQTLAFHFLFSAQAFIGYQKQYHIHMLLWKQMLKVVKVVIP